MADEKAPTLDDVLPSEGTSEFQIAIAGLTDGAQDQAVEALREAAAENGGSLEGVDLEAIIRDARDANAAREEAEDARVDQAKAAEAGDFEAAREAAEKVEDNLEIVEAKGVDPIAAGEAIITAQSDQSDLEYADYHQEIANESAAYAVDAAEAGDADHALAYADAAADHGAAAADFGEQADAGSADAAATADVQDDPSATGTE